MQHAAHSPYRAASSRGGDKEPLGRILDLGSDAWMVLCVTLGVALLFHAGAAGRNTGMFNKLATAWFRALGGRPCCRIYGKARPEANWRIIEVHAT